MIKLMVRGNGWVGTLALLVGFFLFSINSLEARTSIKNVATLDERITVARDSFEDIYYELVKQGFFDVYYNNNLILSPKINENFTIPRRNNKV